MIGFILSASGNKTTEVMLCTSQSSYRGHMMSICPTTINVHFDHLVKVGSANFAHCRVTIFPFIINKYLWGDTLRL